MMNECPLCNNESPILVGRPLVATKVMKYIRKDYFVAWCKVCDFYYITPKIEITAKEWQELYEDEYFVPLTAWWKRRRQGDRIERLKKMVLIRQKLAGNNGETKIKLLDIGCGEGLTLALALNNNWQAYGCDIADNLLPELGGHISYYKGDVLAAGYPSGSFDFIYMDSVLEHVVNPVDLLREFKRILAPGGVGYIAVPNEKSLYNAVKRMLYNLTGKKEIAVQLKPFMAPYHINGFSPGSLRDALNKSCLQVSNLKTFAGEYEWRRFPVFSAPWLTELGLLPVYIMGCLISRAMYLEAYIINSSDK